MDYSTKKVSTALVEELVDAIQNIRGWGSVEIQVQDYTVVQITERNIKKTPQTTQNITRNRKNLKLLQSRS